jgi:hypothetical protein
MAVIGRYGILRLSPQAVPPSTTTPYTGFRTQINLVDWSLNLSHNEIDTTAIGEAFGDAVKSGVVSGGGSLNFLVERSQASTTAEDSTLLLELLFLANPGANALAEFWMIRDRPTLSCSVLAPGSLYYTADIQITSTVINTAADNLISGSAEFITIGEINLVATGAATP